MFFVNKYSSFKFELCRLVNVDTFSGLQFMCSFTLDYIMWKEKYQNFSLKTSTSENILNSQKTGVEVYRYG